MKNHTPKNPFKGKNATQRWRLIMAFSSMTNNAAGWHFTGTNS